MTCATVSVPFHTIRQLYQMHFNTVLLNIITARPTNKTAFVFREPYRVIYRAINSIRRFCYSSIIIIIIIIIRQLFKKFSNK